MMISPISGPSGAPPIIGSGSGPGTGSSGGSGDPFGPAVIVGPAKPKTIFVVYTPQGTLSGSPPAPAQPIYPGSPAPINPLHVNPFYGPVVASPGAVNVPDQITFNHQGQTVRQVTLNANTGTVRIHYRTLV